MGWLVAGLMLALSVWGAMAWYANTKVATVKKTLISLGFSMLFVGVILLGIAVVRGNIGFLPLMMLAIPIVRKLGNQAKKQDFNHRFRARPESGTTMSRAEALEILGLEEGANPDEIKAAYRRLIASAHPDVGGSDWMAAKLNDAKRTLLGD